MKREKGRERFLGETKRTETKQRGERNTVRESVCSLNLLEFALFSVISLCCSSDSYLKFSKKSLISELDLLFEEFLVFVGALLLSDLLIR